VPSRRKVTWRTASTLESAAILTSWLAGTFPTTRLRVPEFVVCALCSLPATVRGSPTTLTNTETIAPSCFLKARSDGVRARIWHG
jgi:hypothetical protein